MNNRQKYQCNTSSNCDSLEGFSLSRQCLTAVVIGVALISPLRAQVLSTANTVFVDPKYGNDGTGQRERSDFPFLTINAALTTPTRGAQSGDTIQIRPGNYSTSGTVAISKNNLSIIAYGAILSATSQSDVAKLSITGTGNRVRGMEINGNWTGAADVDVGVVEISNTDNIVQDCYIHHSAGHGIRLVQNYSRTTVNNNRVEYCNVGIPAALYGTTNVDGLDIIYNLVQNNRNGGIRPTNNSGGARYIRNEKIVGNTVQNNGINSLNIELWGGGLGGTYAPHQRAIVTNNYVGGGSAFGISMNACVESIVSDNVVYTGVYCGIEWANSKRSKSSGNYIDAASVTNPAGGGGISLSNNEGTGANTNIDIDDNYIVNANVGSGIGAGSMNGVHVRHNSIYGTVTPLAFSFCQNVEVRGNYAEINLDVSYSIYTEAAAAATVSGFYYIDNHFVHTTSTSGYPVYFFYSSGSNSTFNDVHIEGTRTNQTFAGTGFIDPGNNSIRASIRDNQPAVSVWASEQFGFANTEVPFSLSYSNTDYTNAGGANSHEIFDNPSSVGQTVTERIINGTLRFKHRTDYVGGNYFTGGSIYSFDAPISTNGATWLAGTGAPNGVVTASVGSLYTRTDGGAGTTLYVKESGSGNTGWVAK